MVKLSPGQKGYTYLLLLNGFQLHLPLSHLYMLAYFIVEPYPYLGYNLIEYLGL